MTTTKILTIITAAVLMGGLLYATQDSVFADKENRNFKVKLDGSQEVPMVGTDTTGKAKLKVNKEMTEIKYSVEVKNGIDVLAADPAGGIHIHCGAAGANGPIILWLAGKLPVGLDGKLSVKGTLTEDNIVNDSCGATIAAILDSMQAGETYINVHSVPWPGGVVRGQI